MIQLRSGLDAMMSRGIAAPPAVSDCDGPVKIRSGITAKTTAMSANELRVSSAASRATGELSVRSAASRATGELRDRSVASAAIVELDAPGLMSLGEDRDVVVASLRRSTDAPSTALCSDPIESGRVCNVITTLCAG